MTKPYTYTRFDDRANTAVTTTIYPNGKVVSFSIPRFQYEKQAIQNKR